jgi:spore germination protein GerM
MRKLLFLGLVLLLAGTLLVGCGIETAGNAAPVHQENTEDPPEDKIDEVVTEENVEGTEDAENGYDEKEDGAESNTPSLPAKEIKITLYFADLKAIETGEQGEHGYVVPVERRIPYTEGVLRAALEELIRGPLPADGQVGRTLPESAKVGGITVKDGLATLNFDDKTFVDHQGGTLGGAITVQSLVFTAIQFPSVDHVVVLAGGTPWSDGHFVWDRPLGAEDLLN